MKTKGMMIAVVLLLLIQFNPLVVYSDRTVASAADDVINSGATFDAATKALKVTGHTNDKKNYLKILPFVATLSSTKTAKDRYRISGIGYSINIYSKDMYGYGGVEYEIVLYEAPTSNVFNLPIETVGLNLIYQPPLDEELNAKDYTTLNATHAMVGKTIMFYRPLDVVGSYAVYDSVTGVKVAHIYRPFIYDSIGVGVWGKMKVANGSLAITVPNNFLKMAKYPLTIDPYIGYSTIGSSSMNLDNAILGSVFTLSETLLVYNITTAIKSSYASNSVKVKAAIYKHSDLSLVGQTDERTLTLGTSYSWYVFTFSTVKTLTAGDYILAVWGGVTSGSAELAYDSGATNQGHTQGLTYAANFPNPMVPTHSTNLVSIYTTNLSPTNDACDSTATFVGGVDGWVNVTVTDKNGVADFATVDINVTTAGNEFFILRWTQSTGNFSEVSDPSGIVVLSGSSARTNTDADTDVIKFCFSIAPSATNGAASVKAITTDDQAAVDTDTYSAEFTLVDAPTNDACDSTAIFLGDFYGWVNVTVSDLDGVTNLQTVDINVTLADGKFFILRWTQSTGNFSELADATGIATLNTTSSVRTNVDFDTDIISFNFKVGLETTLGYADVKVITTDDQSLSDTDIYTDEFYVYVPSATPWDILITALMAIIDYVFSYFAIPDFSATFIGLIDTFKTYLIESIAYMVTFLSSTFTLLTEVALFIFNQFAGVVNLFVQIATIVKQILDGTSSFATGVGDLWSYINLTEWQGFIPIILLISWFVSIDDRGRRTGSWMSVFMGDITTIISVLSYIFSIASQVLSTLIDLVFRVISVIPI